MEPIFKDFTEEEKTKILAILDGVREGVLKGDIKELIIVSLDNEKSHLTCCCSQKGLSIAIDKLVEKYLS